MSEDVELMLLADKKSLEDSLSRKELARWNWEQSAKHRTAERDQALADLARLRAENEGLSLRAEKAEREAAANHSAWRSQIDISRRVLAACQSLSRRWREERAKCSGCPELASNDDIRAEAHSDLRARLRTIACALRDLSPGPHPGPMDAEDFLPLVAGKLARLERVAERVADAALAPSAQAGEETKP